AHSSGADATSIAQVISPTAKPERMRSLCKALLRSLRRIAVRWDFSIRDYESSHQDPLVPAQSGEGAWIPACAGMSRVFRCARSPRPRAPPAGPAPFGALPAPAPAAGAARKPARADGVLRTAGNSHGDVSGR